jgi:hypothetical protein
MTGRNAWLLKATALPTEERFRGYAAVNRALEIGFSAKRLLRPCTFSHRGRRVRADAGDFLLTCDGGGSSGKFAWGGDEVNALKVMPGEVHGASLHPCVLALYHDFGILAESLINLAAALRGLGFMRLIFLTSSTLRERLPGVDVLLLPAGDSTIIAQGLGPSGAEAIRDYVANGGGLVALCESALLAALPSSPERTIGPPEEAYQGPASQLRMLQCDVLNEFSDLTAQSCSYKRFGTAVRVNAFQGEVLAKVVKPMHPVMLGYRGHIELYADGPILSTTTSSEGLCTFHRPTARTIHNISEDLAWRLAADRSAIIAGAFKAGRIVLASAHLESPQMPSSWPLLGNIAFWCASERPAPPSEEEGPPQQGDPFRLVDSALHQLAFIQGEVPPLRANMELITARLLAVLGPDATDAWDSGVRAMPPLSKALAEFSRSCTALAHTYTRSQSLRASLESFASPQGGRANHPGLTALSRAEEEALSVLSTASKALQILGGIVEQIGRGMTEVASLAELEATMKPDAATIRTLRCSALTVVAALVGGAPFHSPWYDGELGPCHNTWLAKGQEGVIAPILGLASALDRANMRLDNAIAIGLG